MDAELSRLVSERCGCEVDASFIRRKEFRFAWGTRDGHPVIQVSDYLRDAPDQVLTDFGEMLVRRSRKQKTVMPASFCEYVATDGFVISRRPVYIDRSRNLLRTDIGDKYVADAMQKSGAQIGGEQSGHIILSDYAVTGDGILTSVKLAELVAEKKLSRLADIRMLPQYNASVRVKDKVRVLGDEYLRGFIDRARRGVSRLVVRASGTEPVVRIFAEAESMKQARSAVERVRAEIQAAEEG